MTAPARQSPFSPAMRQLYGGQGFEPSQASQVARVPSQPAGLVPEQGVPVLLPGANFPPAGAVPVDAIGDANLAPGAVGALVQIQVPDALRFRVVGIGFHTDDGAAIGFLSWRILVNGDTIPGYFNVLSAVGSVRQLAEISLVVGSSALVVVQAVIDPTAVLTYRYACRIRGWFYTEKVVE